MNYLNERCWVDEDGVYYYDATTPLTYDDLIAYINDHQAMQAAKFAKFRKYYKGKHDILYSKAKPNGKPDNRVMLNFPKKLVDTFTGFAVGKPVQITLKEDLANEELGNFNRTVKMPSVIARVWKAASIYGRGFFYVFNDGESINVTDSSPRDTFVVYDTSVAHKPLYAVRYGDGGLAKGYRITLYSADECWNFTASASGGNLPEPVVNPFHALPIIEAVENEERLGVIENTSSIVDELNKAISEKANDVDYFADAYLKVLGVILTDEQLENLRDNRIINARSRTDDDDAGEPLDVEFLSKPNADETQENLINRLSDMIYQMSMIVNLNDKDFGNSTGVALQMKYKPMLNLATLKARGFSETLRDVYSVIFGSELLQHIDATAASDLDISYQYDLPHDALSEAQTAQILAGLVSTQTWLKQLSIVDDPQQEAERIEAQKDKERQETADYLQDNHYMTDGEADEGKEPASEG